MTEQGITEDGLFESVLCRLSANAFTCIVRCGVRDIDAFLKLDLAELTEVGLNIIKELSSTQQWTREQMPNIGIASPTAKPIDAPIADIESGESLGQTVRIEDDSEMLRLILNSLSVRAQNALNYGRVKKLSEFMRLAPNVMASWPNTGAKTTAELLNIQKRLNELIHQCKKQGKQLDQNAVCKLLNLPIKTPSQRVVQKALTRHLVPLKPVECRADEPAPWSVLKKTMPDLLSIGGNSLDALRAATENQCISDVVSLPASDWDRLAAENIFRDDRSDVLLSLTLDYLIELRISARTFDILLKAVASWADTDSSTYTSSLIGGASDQSILSDSEIANICCLRIDSFDVPEELLQKLPDSSLPTWRDLVGVTEKDILKKSDTYIDAVLQIHTLWQMKLFAKKATMEVSDLGTECFADFNSMMQTLIDLAVKNPRNKKIFRRRIGMVQNRIYTLEEIGNTFGLSRERVRQIVSRATTAIKSLSINNKFKKLWIVLDEILKSNGGACTFTEMAEQMAVKLGWKMKPDLIPLEWLLEIFGKVVINRNDGIVYDDKHTCLNCNIVALALKDMFAENCEEQSLQKVICDLKLECVRHDCCVKNKFVPQFSEGFARIIINKSDLLFDEGAVYCSSTWGNKRGTRLHLVESILKSAGLPMHFSEVYQQVKNLHPDDKRVTEHNVYSWLGRTENILLWDRGTYVHRDQVEIPDELIGEVERWLQKRLESGVPFVSVAGTYLAFKEQLVATNVPSESALYSCLRELGHPKLAYPRYPYVVSSDAECERIPVSIALEQYVLDAGGLTTFQEIKAYAVEELCIAEQMFAIHIYNVPNLIRTGKGHYVHFQNLTLDHARLGAVLSHASGLLATEGHVSVEKVYSDKQISCKTMGIDSAEMLYAVFQAHADEDMHLPRYPQIMSVDYHNMSEGSRGVLNDVEDYIALRKNPCSFDELEQHFTEDLGYKIGTVYNVIIRDSVVRYSCGSLIHLDTLDWTEDKQRAIEAEARTVIDQAHRAGRCYGLISSLLEYGQLPRLDNDVVWTPTLLAELLTRSSDFRVLGNARNAFVTLPNEAEIETFEDLVCELLQTRYEGACDLESFEEDMRTAGIVQKRVTPGMLGNQERVVIARRLIMLRELYVDAT